MTQLKRLLPAAGLFLLCAYFTFAARKNGMQLFLTPENWFAMAGQYAYLLIIGMGATLVILAGGIDLSVGSVLALSGVTAAHLITKAGWPVPAGMAMGVLVGAVCGVLNGLVTTRLRVPPFIATLGMMLVARGAALRIAKGVTVDGMPDTFNQIAIGTVQRIPVPLILIVCVAAATAFLLHYTKFGRYIYAIGSNPEAARVSGVSVDGVRIGAYVLGGALAGLAGLIETGRLGSGNPTGGQSYELDVVTAVVVGGASLVGGEGRVSGTLIGALLIAVLRNGSNLLGVDPFDQNIYIGLLIIVAVAFDQWARRRA